MDALFRQVQRQAQALVKDTEVVHAANQEHASVKGVLLAG
jgi:hypothetical protein